tara:strand:- start:1427 stop:3883 length:2457 start_codon:yes stop_codon:yes gene_type:complete
MGINQGREKMNKLTAMLFVSTSLYAMGAPAQAAEETTLDEIIVTAQKRAQNLQDVPISVNAFSRDFIDVVGAESMGDLDEFTPGLSVGSGQTTQPSYSIRGIGSSDFGVGTEPAVGVYVDGIYSARSGAALVFFSDVERVEVLKGPQGTLFGRNTAAGAVSIVTKKPSDQREGRIQARYGSDNKRRLEATMNFPLTDKLAVRANWLINKSDGYVTDAVTGEGLNREDNAAFRVAVRWRPGENTDINLNFEQDKTDKDGNAAIAVATHSLSGGDPYGAFANDVEKGNEKRELNGVFLSVQHDFGAAELKTLTSYKEFTTSIRNDEDGTNLPAFYLDTENREDNKQFYQEIQLSGDTDALTWMVGGSYHWEDGKQAHSVNAKTESIDTLLGALSGGALSIFAPFIDAGVPLGGRIWNETLFNHTKNNSLAAFADVTWKATDKLNLSMGVRYTRDSKDFTWENGGRTIEEIDLFVLPGAYYNGYIAQLNAGLGTSIPLFDPAANIPFDDFSKMILGGVVGGNGDLIFNLGPAIEGQMVNVDDVWTDFSPRFVADYKITDDVMIFASVAKGYKAGGYSGLEVNSSFNPEKVWNYEVGLKSTLMDGKLRLNLSAYHYKYKDLQEISFEKTSPDGLPLYFTRTGDMKAWGLDGEIRYLVNDNLQLFASLGLVDAKWSRRQQRSAVTTELIDISGQPTGAPTTDLIVGFDYDHSLGNSGSLQFHLDHSYTSAPRDNDLTGENLMPLLGYVDLTKFTGYRTAQHRTNARISWTDGSEHWQMSVFGRNIFDNQYVGSPGGYVAVEFQSPVIKPTRGRFIGIDASYSF